MFGVPNADLGEGEEILGAEILVTGGGRTKIKNRWNVPSGLDQGHPDFQARVAAAGPNNQAPWRG